MPEKKPAFIFRLPDGREVEKARTIEEFCTCIMKVPIASVIYHQIRGDFSRWLRDIGYKNAAESIEEYKQGENIRMDIVSLVLENIDELPNDAVRFMRCIECGARMRKFLICSYCGMPHCKNHIITIGGKSGAIVEICPKCITRFERYLPYEFVFRGEGGKEIGRARDLRRFVEIADIVPESVLKGHFLNWDFAQWFESIGEFEAARNFRLLGEWLRKPRRVESWKKLLFDCMFRDVDAIFFKPRRV
ncbi:MAG: hypothetical protein QXP42_00655 [Candidatus Micrarchaeia archaeon]